jgi:hypothetical protein
VKGQGKVMGRFLIQAPVKEWKHLAAWKAGRKDTERKQYMIEPSKYNEGKGVRVGEGGHCLIEQSFD